MPVDLNRDYVNDLFTRETEAFITRADPKPFFIYLNYTVPHAELRAPEDAMAPFKDRFLPETPFVNAAADGRPAGAMPDGASLGYRSQPTPRAAFAAMITRMDRDIARLTDLIGERKIDRNTLILFVSDNGPHREGGADPEFFRSAGGQRGIKRDLYEGGHSRADGRPLGRHDSGRTRQLSRVGTLGHAADAHRARRREDARRNRRQVDGARAQGASRSRRRSSCTGSSTSAASSRPCAWGSGRLCG